MGDPTGGGDEEVRNDAGVLFFVDVEDEAVDEEPKWDDERCEEEVEVFVEPRVEEVWWVAVGHVGEGVVFDDMAVKPPMVALVGPKVAEDVGEDLVGGFGFDEGVMAGLVGAGDGDADIEVAHDEDAEDF